MEQLRDICGLDPIGIWPLPFITQALIIILMIILIILGIVTYKKIKLYKNSSYAMFNRLQHNLSNMTAKQVTEEIIHLLKISLIKKYGRKLVAGKNGEQLLLLLKDLDQNNFDWVKYGNDLLKITYMPEQGSINENLNLVVTATGNWIKKNHV